MVNTPIPHSLGSEAKKAAKILRDFTIPTPKAGPDKIIPAGLVESAAGIAVITVFRVGFLLSARAGSGIVIARLHNGEWSAPSAIGLAGLGGGFEAGAEVTDFVIILHSKNALDAFSKGGNLTLGGNFTIAAGPMGRNLEGDIALRSPAAIYTYSKTKGLFAGISIEGSALIERKDANKKFYGRDDVRSWHMLGGEVKAPPACEELYEVLRNHRRMYERAVMAQAKKHARQGISRGVDEGAKKYGMTATVNKIKNIQSHQTKRTSAITTSPDGRSVQQSYAERSKYSLSRNGSKKGSALDVQSRGHQHASHRQARDVTDHHTPLAAGLLDVGAVTAASSVHTSVDRYSWSPPVGQHQSQRLTVEADYGFQAQMECDLSFESGDIIEVLTRTHTQQDWWEGMLHNRIGIFPANYVTVMST